MSAAVNSVSDVKVAASTVGGSEHSLVSCVSADAARAGKLLDGGRTSIEVGSGLRFLLISMDVPACLLDSARMLMMTMKRSI